MIGYKKLKKVKAWSIGDNLDYHTCDFSSLHTLITQKNEKCGIKKMSK